MTAKKLPFPMAASTELQLAVLTRQVPDFIEIADLLSRTVVLRSDQRGAFDVLARGATILDIADRECILRAAVALMREDLPLVANCLGTSVEALKKIGTWPLFPFSQTIRGTFMSIAGPGAVFGHKSHVWSNRSRKAR